MGEEICVSRISTLWKVSDVNPIFVVCWTPLSSDSISSRPLED